MRVLNTHRLTLEPLSVDHARKLFYSCQDERIYEYIPLSKPLNIQALEDNYHRRVVGPPDEWEEKWLNWVVFSKTTSFYVGLIEATVNKSEAKLAYTIFPENWRKGYAKEACAAVIEELASSYSVKRITAEVDTRNAASIALLDSLGFERVREIREADFFKGQVSHEWLYQLDLS